jgi:hypothetical protein
VTSVQHIKVAKRLIDQALAQADDGPTCGGHRHWGPPSTPVQDRPVWVPQEERL